MFTAEFFAGNRLSLQQSIGGGLIVLSANGLLQRSADTTFEFRQDSNFWYLTGINEPDYILVVNEPDCFLIAPKRHEHRDQWDGYVDKKQLSKISGITEVYEYHEGWNKLDRLMKKYKKVYTITPAEAYIDVFGFYANPARQTLLNFLSKHRKVEMVDIRKRIAGLRQVKQQPELDAIKSAIDVTCKSLESVRKKLAKYSNERQIYADISRDFTRAGSYGHAYKPIIASGGNSTTIHYVGNDSNIERDQLILFDVGAEVENYSADISRTYAVGQASARHKQVHAVVLEVQQYAFELLKPGVDMKKYEQQIDKFMARQLKKLKLIDDVNDKKKLKKYYPHLASHFLGLDTHDAADYKLPLRPGMVLTVEPGIYIPEEGIGVRVEDDVLVTEKGIEILSDGLARGLS